MEKIIDKAFMLFCILSLAFFGSCSKETYSGDEDIEGKESAVTWDNTAYNVSYLMDIPVASSAPSNDMGFYVNLALENSEKPKKLLSLSCKNYLYGEEVDLTTNKYSTKIEFNDGQSTYRVDGGSSRVKAGSYYKLTRKGNHIDLIIDLTYSGDNGYEHILKVKYGGELPKENYLPSENWQNEPFPHYSFAIDEAQYFYRSFIDFKSVPFVFDVANGNNSGSLRVWANNFKYNEKVDLSQKGNSGEITLYLTSKKEGETKYEWYDDAILEGSYLYIKKEDSWNGEAVLDAKCKDEDGTVHHIQAEYNVYK